MATTLVSTGASLFYATRPLHVGLTAWFSFALLSPMIWWTMKQRLGSGKFTPNIHYQNDCTPEEIERFHQQDIIEEAAARMKLEQGYGYVKRGDPSFF